MQINRPRHTPDHADRCLDSLAEHHLGDKLSLGGAFGLLCYLDYRPTHDLDAWWQPDAALEERARVVTVIRAALEEIGEVHVRSWGEVVSIELLQDSKKVFSFQIAERSAILEEPTFAPWTEVLLDSLADLIANKMIALVERGAPRDFRDIYTVCDHGLMDPTACWRLWRERQAKAGAPADARRARLAVETHLARIVQHRPLDRIADPTERSAAERARRWYEKELLDALVD